MTKEFTTYSNLLGLVIQELREKHGFSQQSLAEKLNVTRVTVSKIENGQSDITTPTYLKLREIFSREPDGDIFMITDNKKRLLEEKGVTVYDSWHDVPEKQKNPTGDSNAIKYIAGAAALGAIIAFLANR